MIEKRLRTGNKSSHWVQLSLDEIDNKFISYLRSNGGGCLCRVGNDGKLHDVLNQDVIVSDVRFTHPTKEGTYVEFWDGKSQLKDIDLPS